MNRTAPFPAPLARVAYLYEDDSSAEYFDSVAYTEEAITRLVAEYVGKYQNVHVTRYDYTPGPATVTFYRRNHRTAEIVEYDGYAED